MVMNVCSRRLLRSIVAIGTTEALRMIDHISVAVRDLDRAARFYEAVLKPLGLTRLVTRPATIGFGKAY